MSELLYPRPPRLYFLATSLMPFASVTVAAALTGMSAITTVCALIGTLGAMAAAGTFVMSWVPAPGQSRWRSKFVLWINEPKPNRLQRWYAPLFAAAVAGVLSEIGRSVVAFASVGARLSGNDIAAASGIGLVEGVLVALAFGAGFGLAGFIRPSFAKRAT
jgi:hypothetical protein